MEHIWDKTSNHGHDGGGGCIVTGYRGILNPIRWDTRSVAMVIYPCNCKCPPKYIMVCHPGLAKL